MSNTKNKPLIDPVALAESLLDDAKAAHQKAVSDVELAQEELDLVNSRLARADQSVTPTDLINAEFGLKRANGLVTATEAEIQTAQRHLDNVVADAEPWLAQLIKDGIDANPWAAGLWGIPVTVGRPPAAKDAPGHPAVFVYQEVPNREQVRQQAEASRGGRQWGTVNLVVVTPDRKGIDTGQLQRFLIGLAGEAGGDARPSASSDALGSRVRVDLARVRLDLPVLPAKKPNEYIARSIGGTVADAVKKAGPKEYRQSRSLAGEKVEVPVVESWVIRSELVDQTVVDRAITRNAEVEVRFTRAPGNLIRTTIEGLVGIWVDGIGKVEEVKITELRDEFGQDSKDRPMSKHLVKASMILKARQSR